MADCDQTFTPPANYRSHAGAVRGLRDAVPVLLGFLPFGLVLGAQATQKGLSAVEVPLLTGLNFGGGSEFAAIAMWTSPLQVALLVAITFMVNSRHLLMGMALAPMVRHLPRRMVLPALFLMCDESWAMGLADAQRRGGRLDLGYYLGLSLALYLTWITATAAGAVIGPVLGDASRFGFDMAFPAVFLVMLARMWKGTRAALPWLVSLVCAGLVYLALPGAWYVPAGALSGVIAAYLLARSQ